MLFIIDDVESGDMSAVIWRFQLPQLYSFPEHCCRRDERSRVAGRPRHEFEIPLSC